MYYSEYKPTCTDRYFGRTSADEFKTKCIMPAENHSYEQEKALAVQFRKDSNKYRAGMWPYMSSEVYNSPSCSCRGEQEDCYSRHCHRKCNNQQDEGCRKGHCYQRSRARTNYSCPKRHGSDMEMVRRDYFPGPGDGSLSVYKHKSGRGLQRKTSSIIKENTIIPNPSQSCLAILKTKQYQLKEDTSTNNTQNPVKLSTSDNTISVPDIPIKKPLTDTRVIGYVMFNPENPNSCPYISSLAGIRIFPDKIEQGEHEGWAWSVSEMHNLMNDTLLTTTKCSDPMREYKPTCVERNYGSLVPRHLKAKCFIPYNSPVEDNVQVNANYPAPNVLMNLAMTKNPQRLCKPCCERRDREQQSNIKTLVCCGGRYEDHDCCRPCPDRHSGSSHSDLESKNESKMSLKSKSAVTSSSVLSLTSRKGKSRSKSQFNYMMAYPAMNPMYGPTMFGPGGPYIFPVMDPAIMLEKDNDVSRTDSNTDLRAPTFPNSKVVGLVNYDKSHPFCGPYITAPSGRRIYSQRRENDMGTSYVWPQSVLEELIYKSQGRQDVSCYANLVDYDKNFVIEDESTTSDQLSDDSTSFKTKLSFQTKHSPVKSVNCKNTNEKRDAVTRNPVFKNAGSHFGHTDVSRTDSYEINCSYIHDYAITSNDDLSRYTRSSSEWVDNETGDVVNQSIGVQYSEVEVGEDANSVKIDRQISTSSLLKSQTVYGTPTFDSNTKSIQVGCWATSEIGTSPNPIPLKINSLVQADLKEVAMMDLGDSIPFDINKDNFFEYNSSLSTHRSLSQRLRYLSRPSGHKISSSQDSQSKMISLSTSKSGFQERNKNKQFPTRKLYENHDLRYVESRQNIRVTAQQRRDEKLYNHRCSKSKSKVPDTRQLHIPSYRRDKKLSRPVKSTSEEALSKMHFERPLRRKCEGSTRHQTSPLRSETGLECTDPSSLKSSRPKKSTNLIRGTWESVDAESNERTSTQAKTCSTCKRKGDMDEQSQIQAEQKSSRVQNKNTKHTTSSSLDYQTKHGKREDCQKKCSYEGNCETSKNQRTHGHSRLSSVPMQMDNTDNFSHTPSAKYGLPLHESHEEFCRIWREPECSQSQTIQKHKGRVLKPTSKDKERATKAKKLRSLSHRSECHTDSLMSNSAEPPNMAHALLVSDRQNQKKVDHSESYRSQQDCASLNFALISDSVLESTVQLTEDHSQPSRIASSQNRSTNLRHLEECSRSQTVTSVPPYAMALCPQCEHSEHTVPSELFRPRELPKRKSKKKKRWYFEGIRFAAKK